ncbi:MAG: tandem-95 repeat protein [Magnetococcales bacterium]|nr:tandem-95 repeat protein [Magnetococcales bacterium]
MSIVSVLFCFHASAETVDFSYDDLNRLIRIERENVSITEYAYDEVGNRSSRTISLINEVPVANDGTLNTSENSAASGTLQASDPDGDSLTYRIENQGSLGSASITNASTGAYTYTPNDHVSGEDSFTFTVNDGASDSNSATITVIILPIIHPPTITNPGNQSVDENISTPAIAFTIGDHETPADDLNISAVSSNESLVSNANIVLGGSGAERTVTLTPEEDQSGTATITLTVSDEFDTTSISFVLTVNPVNDPPTLSEISYQSIDEDTATSAIGFTIGDRESSADDLSVHAVSSDSTLIPDANIQLGGSGDNRTVTITPADDQYGTATITLTVSDEFDTTSISFVLTVNPVNDPPTLSDITDQSTDKNTPTNAIAFTIGDLESSADLLTVSATSSDTTLVTDANIQLNGSGENRTATLTPTTDQKGSTTITITVGDGELAISDSFILTVIETGADTDGDGVLDEEDNCPSVANPNQEDLDGDAVGNTCDLDDDNDGMSDLDEMDYGLDPEDPGDADSDLDGDGVSNLEEILAGTDPTDPADTPIALPVAEAGLNMTYDVNTEVTLDGSCSSAPDPTQELTYLWSINSQPIGSDITLSSDTLVNPTFTPTVSGTYEFGLTVHDGAQWSAGDSVTITIEELNYQPGEEGPKTVVGRIVRLDSQCATPLTHPAETDIVVTVTDIHGVSSTLTDGIDENGVLTYDDTEGLLTIVITNLSDLSEAWQIGDGLTIDVMVNPTDTETSEYLNQTYTLDSQSLQYFGNLQLTQGSTITHQYTTGFNLAPYPFENSVITTASKWDAAIREANDGVMVKQIYSWDSSNQRFDYPYVNVMVDGEVLPNGQEIDLKAGSAYFIDMDGEASLQLQGQEFTSVDLVQGLNLISIPPSKKESITSLAEFRAEVMDHSDGLFVDMIQSWDPINQRYDTAYLYFEKDGVVYELNPEILIDTDAKGFFINATDSGTYRP